MPAKPLKVFLSYSHLDRPKLLTKFRKHLKSLETDQIIEVWFDRNIAAGDDWDKEIHARLDDCVLFVALTSANFNGSAYIEGEEMRVAWKRHDAQTCRIFPVLWEKWRLTERWRKLQFVPADDADVVSAKNPNDPMLLVVAKMEEVANKIRESPADPSLPYLCGWTRPTRQLRQLKGESDAEKPMLLVLVGGDDDGVQEFLSRIHSNEMAGIHRACGRGIPDPRIMYWTADSSRVVQRLYAALDAKSEMPLDRRVQEGMNVVKTMVEGWSSSDAAGLEELLKELEQPHWTMRDSRALLVVLCVSNPSLVRSNESYGSEIGRILESYPAIRSTTIAMPQISLEEARSWFERPEVRRYHNGEYACFKKRLAALFGSKATLKMKPLAEELLRILKECGEPE